MDNLILAIALLGVGVLGMGWLSWSARSTKKTGVAVLDAGEVEGHNEKGIYDRAPFSASPKIVAFCRTPSTMMVKEDRDNFYVTYMVGKHHNSKVRRYESNN